MFACPAARKTYVWKASNWGLTYLFHVGLASEDILLLPVINRPLLLWPMRHNDPDWLWFPCCEAQETTQILRAIERTEVNTPATRMCNCGNGVPLIKNAKIPSLWVCRGLPVARRALFQRHLYIPFPWKKEIHFIISLYTIAIVQKCPGGWRALHSSLLVFCSGS